MTKTHYSDHLLPGQILAITALLALAYLPLVQWLSPQVSAFVAVVLGLRLAAWRWPSLTPGRWILLPLALAGFANVLGAYGTVSGREAGTALLTTALILKLLEIHGKRELRVLTSLFGFLVMSQFLFDQSPLLAAYLLALLVGNVALMADLTARRHVGPAQGAARVAAQLTLLALPLTVVLFLLFPRLSTPLWSLGPDEKIGRTGLSDRLEPGSITELVLSGEPAFRVWFDGTAPPTERMYWRGPVLWQMDGRRWAPSPARLEDRPPQPVARASEPVAYQIVLEPNDQRWLLALDLPIEVPERATLTADFQVRVGQRLTQNERYRMISAIQYATGELDPVMAETGRQLPPNVTGRMRTLVSEWTRDSAMPDQVIARALEHFHREAFYYTLEPPALGANPVDEFVFETRRGYCEHYASALAVLLRLADIPTRIVLGYHGGELNPMGGYYIVRQSDAHAWVEAWIPGQGWQRVDPTAAIAAERIDRSPRLDELGASTPLRFGSDEIGRLAWLAHRLRLAGDALRAGWQNWVLDFSTADQLALMSLIGLGYLGHYGLAIAMVLAASAVLTLTVLALLRRGRVDPIEALYARFCERMRRAGLPRRPSEGPIDFGRRVVALRPELRPQIEPFLSLYTHLRYGRAEPESGLPLLRSYLRRARPGRRVDPNAV